MTKANPTAPEWFDINKYDYLNGLTAHDICKEVLLRVIQKQAILEPGSFNRGFDSDMVENALYSLPRQFGGFSKTLEHLSDDNNELLVIELIYLKLIVSFNHFISSPESFFDTPRFGKENQSVFEMQTYRIKTSLSASNLMIELYEKHRHTLSEKGKEFENAKLEITKAYDNIPSDDRQYISMGKNRLALDDFSGTGVTETIDNMETLFKDTPFYGHVPMKRNIAYIEIDLTTQNDTITKEVISLVEDLRKHEGIDIESLPLHIKTSDNKTGVKGLIKSLIDNRILQYLDLKIWELENNFDLSNNWFLGNMFSDDLALRIMPPQNKMSKTIIPCVEQWTNIEWLNSFALINSK